MPKVEAAPRKCDDVDRITTPVLIENYDDVSDTARGRISAEAIRRVEVAEALIDTGASSPCLPVPLIGALGLRPVMTRAAGPRAVNVFSPVQLTILGRNTIVRPTELPEGSPVLIGQFPLEDLDLVLFPAQRRLAPNPAHGGEWVSEIY